MAITQQHIADRLGISRVLVSYALNGNPRVNAETRQRVLQAAQELGYSPNRAAQMLAKGRTGQILFRSFSQTSTSINELTQRLLLSVQQAGYELLVGNNSKFQRDAVLPAADGAIFLGDAPQHLTRRGFPLVSLQIDLRGPSAGKIGNYDVVQVVHEPACRKAVQHLLDEGCQRVAYVSLPSMMRAYEPRYRAYAAVLKQAGYAREEISFQLPVPFGSREASHRALEEYFERHGFPDALFCSNDDIAIGAYRALREAGRRIPQQTAVIGGDDMAEARDHRPALSSIQWPFDVVCERAWQMLMERIANPSLPPRFEKVKARFVPRASSQRRSTPVTTEAEF